MYMDIPGSGDDIAVPMNLLIDIRLLTDGLITLGNVLVFAFIFKSVIHAYIPCIHTPR